MHMPFLKPTAIFIPTKIFYTFYTFFYMRMLLLFYMSTIEHLTKVGINVYMRILTRVQLTSSREPSSNPPMDMGRVNPGYNPGWGRSHWREVNPG